MMSSKRKTNRQNSGIGGQGNRTGNRGRGSFDNKNLTIEGVYANTRFNHLAVSLVGTVVQLQVKNGGMYDGILKTCSPKMDVVLEMVHKCEDTGNSNQNSTVPSKDRLLERVVFHQNDILTISALDVDLEYAVRDSFTDAAISKCNSNHSEAEMKELQPWEGGEGEEIGALDSRDSSNGWDANDMFRTNAERFNVKSSYDDSLSQYTTPLEKKDTQEYKDKEKHALKLAQEIEKSDSYKQGIELENGGDGDDEEDKFSAVKRNHDGKCHEGSAKYITPARRFQQDRRSYQQRYGANNNLSNSRQGSHMNNIPPRLQNQLHQHHHTQHSHPPHHANNSPVHSPPHHLPSDTTQRVNGSADKEEREKDREREIERCTEADHPSAKPSPNQTDNRVGPASAADSRVNPPQTSDRIGNIQTSPPASVVDRQNSNPKARDATFQELRNFSSKFKLNTEESKKEEAVGRENEEGPSKKNIEPPSENKVTEDKHVETVPSSEEVQQKDSEESGKKLDGSKSVLNVHAKPFQPRTQPQQVPTPPRPQTQSPVTPGIIPTQPMPAAIPYMPVQPSYGMLGTGAPPNIIPVNHQQAAAQTPYKQQPKRAVISINASQQRNDYTAAAAQAATGQPLFNQAAIQPQYQPMSYIPMVQPGYHVGGQVMPMPAATGQRMMTPTSLPLSTSHGAPNQSHQPAGLAFMAPQGQPMPAHLSNFQQPLPAHMPIPAPTQNQQGGQMNPQSGGHPAPSPVQQHPNQQPTQQGRPPNSGTPQPQGTAQFHNIAPSNLQGHPPLIPSPHNQSSQQTMHSMQYTFSSQNAPMYPGQGQGSAMYSQQSHPPTSVSQGMHGSHLNHPQIVVMPSPHHSQVQQTHQHNTQFSHMSGPGQQPIMQHAMPGGLPTNSNIIHQFVPQVQHVQSAPPPPPVQPYQQHSQNH